MKKNTENNSLAIKAVLATANLGIFLLLPLSVFLLSFYRVERKVTASGIVKADNQVVVTSEVKDTVVKTINVNPGETVKKNQIIVVAADLTQVRSQINIITNKMKALSAEIKRDRTIADKGGIALFAIEQKKNRHERLSIEKEQAYKQLARLRVRAPHAGTVSNIYVEINEGLTIGKPVFQLIGGQGRLVECNVPEKQVSYVKPGQKVYLKSNQYNFLRYRIFTGTVRRVAAFGEKTTAEKELSFPVVIATENDSPYLRVNSSVVCEIVRDEVSLPRYVLLQ
jgi:multidrug resistance efflux pump